MNDGLKILAAVLIGGVIGGAMGYISDAVALESMPLFFKLLIGCPVIYFGVPAIIKAAKFNVVAEGPNKDDKGAWIATPMKSFAMWVGMVAFVVFAIAGAS